MVLRRQMLTDLSAVAALLLVLAAPAALACGEHAVGKPCTAEQPGQEYRSFMDRQRADVLADFAARAAARRSAQHQHFGVAGRRRMLSPTQPRTQLQAVAVDEPPPEEAQALRWNRAAAWYSTWRSRLATEKIPEVFESLGGEGIFALAEPQAADLVTAAGVSVAADLMAAIPESPFPGALVVNVSLTANLRSATAGGLGGEAAQRRSCGHEEDPAVIAAANRELAPQVAALLSPNARVAATVTNINVYFHLISANGKYSATSKMVTDQIAALNSAFASARFRFTLSNIYKHSNKNWYPLDIFSANKADMQMRTRTKGAADLNIWVTQLNNGGIIGVASNPWGVGVGYVPYDGVLIDMGTLPGSWYLGYNTGKNAVHEVGHWLGLGHVFSGGCSETNDGCTDTAQMSAPNYACYPKGAKKPNSCPNRPKNQPQSDPVNNFMGYTYDPCMWEFSGQQQARMQAAFNSYRRAANGPAKPMRKPAPRPKPTRKPAPKPTKKKLPAACGGKCGKPKPKAKPTPKPKPKPTKRKLPAACGGKCGKPKPTVKKG